MKRRILWHRVVIAVFAVALLGSGIIYGASLGIQHLSGESGASQADSSIPGSGISESGAPGSGSESALPSSEPEPPPASATITMGGDVLLHYNTVNANKYNDGQYNFIPVFSEIEPYFSSDLNILNLEGPVDVYGGNKDLSAYPSFNFPCEILDAIKDAGVNQLVNANNHAFDKGWNGLLKTRENLKSAALPCVGTYTNQGDYDTPYVIDVNGLRLGIAAYTDSTNGIELKEEYRGFALRRITTQSMESVPSMIDDIKALRAAGAEAVLLSIHWGAEYVDKPNDMQVKIAHALADAGADIIMGSHSHCVQPIEMYSAERPDGPQDALIIYSLGNFFADQTAASKPKTEQGMLVNVKLTFTHKTARLSLEDANYLPTFTNRDAKYAVPGSGYNYGYRILPAGKYAEATTRPDLFGSDERWQACKAAWERVCKVVGDDIPAKKG